MRKILCGKQQFAENSPKSTEKKPKTARTFVSDKKKKRQVVGKSSSYKKTTQISAKPSETQAKSGTGRKIAQAATNQSVAKLYFLAKRKCKSYFYLPFLLTTSHMQKVTYTVRVV